MKNLIFQLLIISVHHFCIFLTWSYMAAHCFYMFPTWSYMAAHCFDFTLLTLDNLTNFHACDILVPIFFVLCYWFVFDIWLQVLIAYMQYNRTLIISFSNLGLYWREHATDSSRAILPDIICCMTYIVISILTRRIFFIQVYFSYTVTISHLTRNYRPYISDKMFRQILMNRCLLSVKTSTTRKIHKSSGDFVHPTYQPTLSYIYIYIYFSTALKGSEKNTSI